MATSHLISSFLYRVTNSSRRDLSHAAPFATAEHKMTLDRYDNSNTPLKAWRRALAMTAPILRNTSATFPSLIENLADKFGMAPALVSDQECLSYRALTERCNSYSTWALAPAPAAGDVGCVPIPQSPE